jgi:hypothetical protein
MAAQSRVNMDEMVIAKLIEDGFAPLSVTRWTLLAAQIGETVMGTVKIRKNATQF